MIGQRYTFRKARRSHARAHHRPLIGDHAHVDVSILHQEPADHADANVDEDITHGLAAMKERFTGGLPSGTSHQHVAQHVQTAPFRHVFPVGEFQFFLQRLDVSKQLRNALQHSIVGRF